MRAPPHETLVVRAVASAMLADGAWTETDLAARGGAVFDKRPRWMGAAASAVVAGHPTREGVTVGNLTTLLSSRPGVVRAIRRAHLVVRRWAMPVVARVPPRWPVPAFESANALASWLELSPAELAWFADAKGLGRDPDLDEPLRHYRTQWVAKRRGGVRLLEAMRTLTRRCTSGRRWCCGSTSKISFFRSRSHAWWRCCAPWGTRTTWRICWGVFARIARMPRARCRCWAPTPPRPTCTPVETPSASLVRRICPKERRRRLRWNRCAYRLDVRLEAAAAAVGATYSRYADDLVFSGGEDFAARAHRFAALVGGMVLDEGFRVNHRKTRIMGKGARQVVGGLVVNAHAQVPRATFDAVKAIIRNSIDRGPSSQNREAHPDFRAHLRGLVGWAGGATGSPRRAKLDALFRQIVW